jgi:hypothetical protein
MSEERLEIVQARQETRTAAGRRRAGTSAAARRERVERSRERAQRLATGEPEDAEAVEPDETEVVEPEHAEAIESDETEVVEPEAEAVDLPEGAVAAPEDASVPEGHEIKGNANSMKYHVPGGRYYEATIGDVFFDTVEHAEAAGYEAPVTDEAVIEEVVEADHEAEAESSEERTDGEDQ